jgi:Bacterial Ig-like domain
VATFTPSAALVGGKTYEATLTAGVKYQVSNALAQDHTLHFRV